MRIEPETTTTDDRLAVAARCWIARHDRDEHPSGGWDDAGRWYPTTAEAQPCCKHVVGPSRAHPYRVMQHCRSAGHVAFLFDVDERELRRAVRRLQSDAEPPSPTIAPPAVEPMGLDMTGLEL